MADKSKKHRPLPKDSDDDGLSDDQERQYGTDPSKADSDGDGLGDFAEILGGTDAMEADTDGDGWNDGREVATGKDPFSFDKLEYRTRGETIGSREALQRPGPGDSDGDGLSDDAEKLWDTDPHQADTDHDGLSDFIEASRGSDPLSGITGDNKHTDVENAAWRKPAVDPAPPRKAHRRADAGDSTDSGDSDGLLAASGIMSDADAARAKEVLDGSVMVPDDPDLAHTSAVLHDPFNDQSSTDDNGAPVSGIGDSDELPDIGIVDYTVSRDTTLASGIADDDTSDSIVLAASTDLGDDTYDPDVSNNATVPASPTNEVPFQDDAGATDLSVGTNAGFADMEGTDIGLNDESVDIS